MTVYNADASLTGSASLTTQANGTFGGNASLTGIASLTASFGVNDQGNASISVSATLTANAFNKLLTASMTGISTVVCKTAKASRAGVANAKTSFFSFSSKCYMLNGTDFLSYDGTSWSVVAGYRPKIAISTPPTGGGTLFEEVNRLTGAKHQTFSPDGIATAFQLAELNNDSIDYVIVNGAPKILGTDYTVNVTKDIITFTVAPITGVPNNTDIGWTKGTGDRASILQNLYATIYGGANDSRIFVYGGSANRLYFTGLADGVPSAEYFPANAYIEVGSDEFSVTSAVKQYDKLLIFTEQGSYYASYSLATLATGEVVPSFPTSYIGAKGNIAYGQARNVLNNPFTIFEGVYQWSLVQLGSDVRNAGYMSKRVQPSLDGVDLTKAITYVHEKNREYWLVVGSVAWIYNYGVDVWYQRENIPASNFLEIDGVLYFGTAGTIMKFDPALLIDNGAYINSRWEMGFYDFGAEYINKYMNNIWVSLKPEVHSSVDLQTVTNVDGTSVKQTIYYNLATFLHCNFNHFSFNTSYNPQPFYVEVQAMGFDYFKLIIVNDSDFYAATVLSINLPARHGGKVR